MSESRSTMLYAGFCRVCETGPLGLRKCGGCERIVLLCDECDAVWTDAAVAEPPRFSSDPELPCPLCNASLIDEPSRWATRDECQREAWVSAAIAAGELELERGEPLQ